MFIPSNVAMVEIYDFINPVHKRRDIRQQCVRVHEQN